ncbi:DUF4274 domain-containing protein [Yoonia sp. SS1-5]|uniref:DUF4274 domain-containing protein n=1 Tax=Yoonia rhodophyticola TaxID=3137370 RepID=A0AAN0NLH5_9RHOB
MPPPLPRPGLKAIPDAGWETHELTTEAKMPELVTWLRNNRDPGLWHAVAEGLNYDLDSSFEVLKWMLWQKDCPNAVAVAIFAQIGWPEVHGMADPPDWNNHVLELLEIISARDAFARFPVDTLSDPRGFDRNALTQACARAAYDAHGAGIKPRIAVPLRTLRAQPVGPLPQTDYVIDEDGVLQWVPAQAS